MLAPHQRICHRRLSVAVDEEEVSLAALREAEEAVLALRQNIPHMREASAKRAARHELAELEKTMRKASRDAMNARAAAEEFG